jgi:hypothetical protein
MVSQDSRPFLPQYSGLGLRRRSGLAQAVSMFKLENRQMALSTTGMQALQSKADAMALHKNLALV